MYKMYFSLFCTFLYMDYLEDFILINMEVFYNGANMIYYNKAKVKRYKRKVKSKTKNNKEQFRIVETVNIGLSKSSEFEDMEEVTIIKTNDFNKILEYETELKNKDKEISILKNELNKLSNVHVQNNTKNDNKLFELLEIINNRNELILKSEKTINRGIDDLLKEISIQQNKLNNKQYEESKNKLRKSFNTYLISIEDILFNEINENLNKKIKDMNRIDLLKSLFSKKINLNISKDDLINSTEKDNKMNNFSIDMIINNSLIKQNDVNFLELKNRFINYDLNELYIKYNLDDDLKKIKYIDV